jgi:hypothetical protein
VSSIRVIHSIDDLADDCRRIAVRGKADMARVTRMNAQRGNRIAKGFAKESAGAHGKHYHRAFSMEAITPLEWEYGPDAAKPQGGMSFEFGSRNQPPHLDLARSADLVGPMFARDVSNLPDKWFW